MEFATTMTQQRFCTRRCRSADAQYRFVRSIKREAEWRVCAAKRCANRFKVTHVNQSKKFCSLKCRWWAFNEVVKRSQGAHYKKVVSARRTSG